MNRQTVSCSTSAGETRENINSATTKLPSDTVDYVAGTAIDNGSAAPNRNAGKVRFPVSQSPLVTLLQKKREGVLPSGASYIDSPSVTDSDKLLSEVMDYLEKESAVIKTGSSNSTTKGNLHQVPSDVKKSTAPGPVAEIVPVSTRRLAFETVAPTGTVLKQKSNDPHSRRFQPRKIEDYEPGRSSLASLDPSTVDGYKSPIVKPGPFSRYLESDTEIEYRIRKKTSPMSPSQTDNSNHDLYKRVQKGGQIPSEGLKYSTFETKRAYSIPSSSLQHHQQQSSHTTADGGMSTFTHEQRENVALRKLELNRLMAEERKKKLEAVSRDIQSRRHSDFFMPSQKSPVPLNRYEEGIDERELLALPSKKKLISKVRGKAKALYNFRAQNSRELSFRKGEVLYLTRQIDRNWFEGERHGMIGRFPISYVEVIISLDLANAAAEDGEGSARALYNFSAQSSVELSLRKGDLVKLIRRVDENWLEGRISSRRGIFPVRYVEILIEPNMSYKTPTTPMSSRTVTPMIGSPLTLSPSNSLISIGPAPTIPSAPISPVDSELMDESRWNPELLYPPPNRWTANSQPAIVASRHLRDREYRVPTPAHQVYYSSGGLDDPLSLAPAQPARPLSRSSSAGQSSDQLTVIIADSGTPSERINGNSFANSVRNLSSAYRFENGDDKASTWVSQSTMKNQPLREKQNVSKPLHLRYPVYRAQYKYMPRKSDELPLNVGDIVYVVEKCVDGWFVGFLERSNDFGTFPGNYVQQLW